MATIKNPVLFTTPDLCDVHAESVRVLEPVFKSFGGKSSFHGAAVTVKCFEDNSRVKELAAQNGHGKVMVVDGGASLRKALLGDLIATNARDNGWEGFIINGCIRDVDIIAELNLGVKALNAIPLKTERRGIGEVNIAINIAGQPIAPGDYVYADNNGVIVSSKPLF